VLWHEDGRRKKDIAGLPGGLRPLWIVVVAVCAGVAGSPRTTAPRTQSLKSNELAAVRIKDRRIRPMVTASVEAGT
jgi:hypothetical protein